MDIESLIGKEVNKLVLPKGFESAPLYKILKNGKTKKKWRKFKKES